MMRIGTDGSYEEVTVSPSPLSVLSFDQSGIPVSSDLQKLKFSEYGGDETITETEVGLGWDELGRFTVQTPFGAWQIYESGTPAIPTLYWPGRIVADDLASVTTVTALPASNLVGPSVISTDIMSHSMPAPLSAWIGAFDRAGDLGGIPYGNTGPIGMTEFVVGDYFPLARVTDGGADNVNDIGGIYLTPAQLSELLSAPKWHGSLAVSPADGASKDGDLYKNTGDGKVYVRTAAATWEALN